MTKGGTEQDTGNVVLDVQDLQTHLFTRWGVTRAVDGVSFRIREGETLGLVGESGSGKSMTALSLLRLLPEAARIVGGRILLDGDDVVRMSMADIRRMRGHKISMILQDPQTALNPVFTVGDQLMESIAEHGSRVRGRAKARASAGTTGVGAGTTNRGRKSVRERAMEVLRMMGVAAPEQRLADFPHQMSGGMKQRVVGGIAIESQPRLLIADEPTTALDVTIQAQYLKLLKEIQRETGVAILFITHDLGVVARMCDRVAVMYAGRIVEQGGIQELFDNPSHPYTQALLGSIPAWRSVSTGSPQLKASRPRSSICRGVAASRRAVRTSTTGARRRIRRSSPVPPGTPQPAGCWRSSGSGRPDKGREPPEALPRDRGAGADEDGGMGARR